MLCAASNSFLCTGKTKQAERQRASARLKPSKELTPLLSGDISGPKYHRYSITVTTDSFWPTLDSTQGTEGSFGIDNEEYEAMPVEVKLLPRKLQFFCDPRRREQMLQAAMQWEFTSEGPTFADFQGHSGEHSPD